MLAENTRQGRLESPPWMERAVNVGSRTFWDAKTPVSTLEKPSWEALPGKALEMLWKALLGGQNVGFQPGKNQNESGHSSYGNYGNPYRAA